eukprot:TRINITY_DN1769_c0_g1_i1.p1 TRINITY_DN1769_c0_g1~~TRINITY_DN1769_c0_g1_i1.p1  ORF type:complete len:382 (-),score=65.26 TRINITY_DN1769_c0_g1_i1:67-1212(-)
MIGNFLFIIGFGFSINFWMAITLRTVSGLFNGNLGVIKSVVREISDNTNQAKAFSLRAVAYSLGMIVGPFIGGYLSNPHENFPSIFGNSVFWERFPFLLPCIFCAIINFVGIIIAYMWFKETLKKNVETINKIDEKTKLLESDSDYHLSSLEEKNNGEDVSDVESQEIPPKKHLSLIQVLKQKYIFVLILIYTLHSFENMAFQELLAVWAISKREVGGILFNEFDLGLAHMFSGVSMLFYQGLLFSRFDKLFGSLNLNRAASLLLVPTMGMFPYINKFYNNKAALWVFVLILMGFQRIFFTTTYSSGDIMLNNASKDGNVGQINGLAASMASLARTLSPFTAGAIYSWSAYNNLKFPFNYSLTFSLISLLCLINFFLTFFR